jgi:hypothetical protein
MLAFEFIIRFVPKFATACTMSTHVSSVCFFSKKRELSTSIEKLVQGSFVSNKFTLFVNDSLVTLVRSSNIQIWWFLAGGKKVFSKIFICIVMRLLALNGILPHHFFHHQMPPISKETFEILQALHAPSQTQRTLHQRLQPS